MVASWMHYRILFVLGKLQNCIARLNHYDNLLKTLTFCPQLLRRRITPLDKSLCNWFPKLIQCTVLSIFWTTGAKWRKWQRKELVLRQSVEELKNDRHIMFETSEKAIDSLTAYSMKEWAILGTGTAGGVRDQRSKYYLWNLIRTIKKQNK